MLQICRTNSYFIDQFSIYGERHSGTNFLEQCISQQFGLNKTEFYGHKHFFGWVKPETITYKGRHTLFACTVRNPYDWIMAMISLPHHIHVHRYQDIEKFLLDEWYSVNHLNNEILEDRNYINKKRYQNIFELRKYKNIYLSQIMPIIAQNYLLISYDTFLKNHKNYLNIISNRLNLRTKNPPPEPIYKSAYHMPSNIKDIIDQNIDWSIEESLGYFKK